MKNNSVNNCFNDAHELFLVFCSTLAGTAHSLTSHMTLVGTKELFPAINGPL